MERPRNQVGFYGAGDLVGIADFPNVRRTLDAFVARPAVAKGLAIPVADAREIR
ncbi:MAG: hypothetical protein H0T52_01735 [Lautropia sp.]|nr:hypothetical protein [Lautropia sp.]